MQKIIILIILSTLFSNCTILEKNEFKNPYYKKAKFCYDNWDLENAKLELEKIEIENIYVKRLDKNIQKRIKEKIKLEEIVEEIKNELNNNNFDKVNKYIKKGIVNNIKLKKIKENDFTNIKIYSGKIKFNDNKAKLLLLFNYLEETVYYEIGFELNNKDWNIYNIKERR